MSKDTVKPRAGGNALTDLTFLFGSLENRALDVVAFIDALPRLCRGALLECDFGSGSAGDHCACVARFRGALPDATTRRLEFWAWRLGGTVLCGSHQGRAALRACNLVQCQVPPERLFGTVRGQLGRFLGAQPILVRVPLSLRLGLGRPEAAGLVFERRGLVLFVPSPMLPPLGEVMALELRLANGEVVRADGIVTKLRNAGQDGPGSPAGFAVGLIAPDEPLMQALEANAYEAPGPEQRRAPRYSVIAPATVRELKDGASGGDLRTGLVGLGHGDEGNIACVENLSQGGAFVRTRVPIPTGTRVRLEMNLPGVTTDVPGIVVHTSEGGIGIRFETDGAGDAAVGLALEHVAVHRRRALVVDDDFLSRRLMSDALAAHGFEVFTAAGGTEGVHALVDLLLDLDLFVIDLHMPDLDGESLTRLVREQGGERDLTIVVMSADVDADVQQRVMAKGADAVLPKSDGMAKIADVAVRSLLRRQRTHRPPSRNLDLLA